jgi:hypothetical protein
LKTYTKAELISKIKGLKTNPGFQSKLLGFFYLIKNFIVKITFLTIIIRIFKRFSLIIRLWLILNAIVMSIFDLSILDIYGLSFLSAFFIELSFITTNVINYLTNTQFYGIISGLLGHKIKTSKTRMSSIDKSSTGNKESSKIIERFNQIINNEPQVEETPFYANKYLIMGSFLLISGLTYYYFGDEIKVYSISLWNWLRGRNPDDGGNNPNPNPTNRFNTISDFLGLNQKNNNKESIIAQIMNADADGSEALEILSDLSKGKEVENSSSILTSPSLDDLNSTAQETWSNSRPTSPESIASSSTIRQRIIPKIKVDTDLSSNNSPHSNSSLLQQLSPNSSIDEALTPNKVNLKPFVKVEMLENKTIYNYNEESFKSLTNKGIKDRMNWIESTIANGNINDLDQDTLNKLHDKVCDVALSYNAYVKDFYKIGGGRNERNQQPIKYFGFLMRDWLQKHLQRI